MKVISPIIVDDSILFSSTIAEDDAGAWSAVTTYALATKVLYDHHVYESLQAGNVGKNPKTEIAWWLDTGASNRYRMFDAQVGTATTATGSMTVDLIPGRAIQAVALLELSNAIEVIVTVTDPVAGIVYLETIDLLADITSSSWWSYFFDPISKASSVVLDDIPSYPDATITIEINAGAAGDTVSCGVCLIGLQTVFAESVDYGLQLGIQDYSQIDRDVFGVTSVVQRSYAKRANWKVRIENTLVDTFHTTLANLRGVPALYIGTDRFSSSMIYGIFNEFYINVNYCNHSDCSVEILGMI